jgi:hypothetical protein
LLNASMTIHLKTFARYNQALSTILGGSRAQGIPQWTKETMGKDLPVAIELLDQVYGEAEDPEGMKIRLGKQLMGLIAVRLLKCKALATALESERPDFRNRLNLFFDEPKERPFIEVYHFIYGPKGDYKLGFIESLAGGRTRFIFRKNVFKEVNSELKDIRKLLITLDQDPKGRGKSYLYYYAGFGLDIFRAVGEHLGKR